MQTFFFFTNTKIDALIYILFLSNDACDLSMIGDEGHSRCNVRLNAIVLH
jgi:hypothetical protein